MDTLRISNLSYFRAPAATPDIINNSPMHDRLSTQSPRNSNGVKAWANTLQPLILHCVSSFGIVGFIILYVDGSYFNIKERTPSVVQIDGTTTKSGQYAPLQSDITTLLSAFLSFFRWLLVTWAGALCWYSLFFLMENTGLPHQDLRKMVTRKCFPLRSYVRDALTLFVGAILIVTTFTQFTAPILTGSITWTPTNQLSETLSNGIVKVSEASDTETWQRYLSGKNWRRRASIQASGFATVAWGRNVENGISKRVLLNMAALEINSTIANVSLPYFSVTSLEWILNPELSLTPDQLNITYGVTPKLSAYEEPDSLSTPGSMAFIPEGDWTTNWTARPFPSSVPTVSETRILVVYTARFPESGACWLNNSDISDSLPSTIGPYYENRSYCYAFARVSYRAGAGMCRNCRLSSNSTVQNDTALILHDDPMTADALRLMPDVINSLVMMNSSIPSTFGNFEDYVTEVLVRSYSGAWTALNRQMRGISPTLSSNSSPAFQTLRADVNRERVYAWLGLQILVTLLGLIFLVMHSRSENPLMGDTSLVPFYLDTTRVRKPDATGKVDIEQQLRLESKGNHWKILAHEPS